jgi:DNA-binding XRE family transcriptional regulator
MATTHINDDPVQIAVGKLVEARLRRLTKSDIDDLQALLPLLSHEDEDEKEAACSAILEIMNPRVVGIRTMDISRADALKSWLQFVSTRLRNTRESAGITQEELAKRTGIQQSHLSRLEQGEHSPTQKTLIKIANALGVAISVFDPSAV